MPADPKGEKRPADVIDEEIMGKQHRHPDNPGRSVASAAYPHRLIFWFFCNFVSPHKQGSFDFSRIRLAFFRHLPD